MQFKMFKCISRRLHLLRDQLLVFLLLIPWDLMYGGGTRPYRPRPHGHRLPSNFWRNLFGSTNFCVHITLVPLCLSRRRLLVWFENFVFLHIVIGWHMTTSHSDGIFLSNEFRHGEGDRLSEQRVWRVAYSLKPSNISTKVSRVQQVQLSRTQPGQLTSLPIVRGMIMGRVNFSCLRKLSNSWQNCYRKNNRARPRTLR